MFLKASDIKECLCFEDGKYQIDVSDKLYDIESNRYIVGCYSYNRAPSRHLFVIVDHDESHYHVIFPRIRIKNYELTFGQDKTNEEFIYDENYECHCYQGQGCDGVCECRGAYRIRGAYADSFTEVEDDYEYKVVKIEKSNEWYLQLSTVKKEWLNDIDEEFPYDIREYIID